MAQELAMMQELDRVHVPHRDSASVTFADVATISKIQAVFRGRIARRRREEEEAAVVAIQVRPPARPPPQLRAASSSCRGSAQCARCSHDRAVGSCAHLRQAAFRGHQVRKRNTQAASLSNYVAPPIGNHKALFLFGHENELRKTIHKLMYNKYTETALLLLIFINMVCMILGSPPPEPGSQLEPFLWRIDTALTAVFITEFLLKIVACGFVFGEHTYLRDTWNRLDFLVVVVSAVSLLADLGLLDLEDMSGAQGLRALRCLRPLRAAKFLPALRLILNAIASSMSEGRMQDVIWLLAFFFSIYAIMGMQMFGGSLRRHCAYISPFNATKIEYTDEFCAPTGAAWGMECEDKTDALPPVAYQCLDDDDDETEELPLGYEPTCAPLDDQRLNCVMDGIHGDFKCKQSVLATCVSARREDPMERAGKTIRFEQGYDFVSFDSFWLTMITLFEICTLEGWTGIMYSLKDCEGPVEVYFVSFLLICSLLMLDLIVGVICDAYAAVSEEENEDGDEDSGTNGAGESYVEMRRAAHEKGAKDGITVGPIRRCCQSLVASPKFEFFILAVVLFNTIMWATVHRGMRISTLRLLGYMEYGCIVIYLLEVFVKVGDLGWSFPKYLHFSSNMFDFVVTVASITFIILALVLNISVNVTMLRALRCTRVLNMSKGLRQIIQTVTSSLKGVLGVMACTIFFMFVYAVMGVQLFHEFSEDFGRESFATFGRGLLTLFQCITGEGWVDVMHAAMITSPIVAPLFFISYYILVNFVLVNVIIAIICANFELSEEEKMERQRRMFQDESKKLSRKQEVTQAFGDKYNPELMVRKLQTLQSHTVRLEEDEDPLDPLERQTTAPGESRASFHLHERVARSEPGAHLDHKSVRDIKMIELLYDRSAELAGQQVEIQPLEDRTCKCFGVFGSAWKGIAKENTIRVKCVSIAKHPQFERMILGAILVSCVLLMLDTPNPAYVVVSATVFFYADLLFLGVFTFECVVKILGYGFYSHQYIGDPWNIPDFVILISMWLEFLEMATFSARAARILRVIRPLRLIKRNPGMRVILTAIGACIRPVTNTLLLWFAFQFIYGILGVNLFAGKFLSCFAGGEDMDVFGQTDCIGTTVGEDGAVLQPEWVNFGGRWYNFDHIGIAMVTLFEVASLEGWLDVMYAAMDIRELDVVGSSDEKILIQRQPFDINAGDIGHPSAIHSMYFITFICLGTFVVINLLVGVFVDSFYQAKGIGLLTDEQRKWYDLRNLIEKKHPKRIDSDEVDRLEYKARGEEPPPIKQHSLRARARRLLAHSRVVNFFTLCIALNMIVLAAQSRSWRGNDVMPADIEAKFKLINVFFVLVFVVEISLKIAAWGSKFWQRSWNKVDFVLMCFSALEFVATVDIFDEATSSLLQNLSRMFRPLRAIRLLELSSGMRMLIRTFFYSLPAIGNVSSLVTLFLFVYAVLGVQLYGTVQAGDALEGEGKTHAHFGNFKAALSLVFRMSTGEDWQAIMHDCAVGVEDGCGCVCESEYESGMAGPSVEGFTSNCMADAEKYCGPGEGAIDTCGNYVSALIYFISFFFLGAYCLMALFTAVVLDCFSVVNHVDSAVVNIDCMKQFKATWAEYDPLATGYIPLCVLQKFVRDLERPLGFDPTQEKTQWKNLYLQCLALHKETADGDDEGMRLVEFNKLIELLAVAPFGEYLQNPQDHLEVKDQIRRDALLKRLEQENAASKVAAQWRGFVARKSMPMNTAVLEAQRTLHSATQQKGSPSAAVGRRAGGGSVVPGMGRHGAAHGGTVVNPLASGAGWDSSPQQQRRPPPADAPVAPARLVKKLSPIDGTIQWVVKGDTNDEAGRSWGADHGMGKYQPSVPQARDAVRGEGKRSGTGGGHGFSFEQRGGGAQRPPARPPAPRTRPRQQYGDEV